MDLFLYSSYSYSNFSVFETYILVCMGRGKSWQKVFLEKFLDYNLLSRASIQQGVCLGSLVWIFNYSWFSLCLWSYMRKVFFFGIAALVTYLEYGFWVEYINERLVIVLFVRAAVTHLHLINFLIINFFHVFLQMMSTWSGLNHSDWIAWIIFFSFFWWDFSCFSIWPWYFAGPYA